MSPMRAPAGDVMAMPSPCPYAASSDSPPPGGCQLTAPSGRPAGMGEPAWTRRPTLRLCVAGKYTAKGCAPYGFPPNEQKPRLVVFRAAPPKPAICCRRGLRWRRQPPALPAARRNPARGLGEGHITDCTIGEEFCYSALVFRGNDQPLICLHKINLSTFCAEIERVTELELCVRMPVLALLGSLVLGPTAALRPP